MARDEEYAARGATTMQGHDKHDRHEHMPQHLVRSHAHEEDVPGTVNLQAAGT